MKAQRFLHTSRIAAFGASITLTLAGCSTASQFSTALDGPVKVAKQAASAANDSGRSLLRASALGLTNSTPVSSSSFACVDSAGADVVNDDLTLFSDAVDTVQRVAAKPTDTTYAGYLKQLRADEKAADKPKSFEDQQAEYEAKVKKDRVRCEKLFAADLSAVGVLQIPPVENRAAPAIFGKIMALDALIKTVLSAVETAKREAAVKKTVTYLVPQMRKAIEQLRMPPSSAFGAIVHYPDGAPDEVTKANGTLLGALINDHRWLLAHRIDASWTQLKRCRDKNKQIERADFSCLIDHEATALTDVLLADSATFQAIAVIDSVQTLTDLDTAVNAADNAATAKSLSTVIDGLVSIASALSNISDAYDKYQKAKE